MPETTSFGVALPIAHSIEDYINPRLRGEHNTWQFPEDRPKYYTTLQFSQYKTPGAPGSVGGIGETIEQVATRIYNGMDATDQQLINGGVNAVQGAGAGISYLMRLISGWVAPGAAAPAAAPSALPSGTMILPLPVQLTDIHRVLWDEKQIVPWAQAAGGLTRTVGGLFGLAPNFFSTMLFDRPEYKRHELSFKLSPRNFAESTAIRDIIVVLNNAMSPSLEAADFLFGFPNIVTVILKPNNGWLFKFKPAVIETLAINYNGGDGKKAFYHGAQNPPESVEFTIHICEIEYWIAGDFNTGST